MFTETELMLLERATEALEKLAVIAQLKDRLLGKREDERTSWGLSATYLDDPKRQGPEPEVEKTWPFGPWRG